MITLTMFNLHASGVSAHAAGVEVKQEIKLTHYTHFSPREIGVSTIVSRSTPDVFGRLQADLSVCHRLQAVVENELDGVVFQPASAGLFVPLKQAG